MGILRAWSIALVKGHAGALATPIPARLTDVLCVDGAEVQGLVVPALSVGPDDAAPCEQGCEREISQAIHHVFNTGQEPPPLQGKHHDDDTVGPWWKATPGSRCQYVILNR